MTDVAWSQVVQCWSSKVGRVTPRSFLCLACGWSHGSVLAHRRRQSCTKCGLPVALTIFATPALIAAYSLGGVHAANEIIHAVTGMSWWAFRNGGVLNDYRPAKVSR